MDSSDSTATTACNNWVRHLLANRRRRATHRNDHGHHDDANDDSIDGPDLAAVAAVDSCDGHQSDGNYDGACHRNAIRVYDEIHRPCCRANSL